jgi:homoaconitase
VARSFARIHETNLKVRIPKYLPSGQAHFGIFQKQGILPLWFADKADYSRIGSGDLIETEGLANLLEGDTQAPVTLRVTKNDGQSFSIPTKHTMSADQIKWLHAGSAINYISSQLH